MKYKKIIYALAGLILWVGMNSCKKDLNRLLNNPNAPTPETADVDLYLNAVQGNFVQFWSNASDNGGSLTRQLFWNGPYYRNNFSPNSFDGEWISAYTGVIKNAQAMIPLAQSQKKYFQSGIARALLAFTLGTLVDDFGDVPYSEANLGLEANLNPKVDPGATAYATAQTLLDSAILDFQKPGAAAGPANDLYYDGDKDKWITMAKTLKLKFYMQVRLVDNSAIAKIQELVTENDLIDDPSEDFAFRFGTNLASPDSRHPHYGIDYPASGGVGEYIGDYFMWMVAAQKYGGNVNLPTNGPAATSGDPRLRYYLYRQATNYSWVDPSICPCYTTSQYGTAQYPSWYPSVPDQTPYCVVGKGYFGRDFGDNSGAPPDGNYRTAWGIYPAGGQFDASQGETVELIMGGKGAGISPMWLSSFTAFLLSEAALVLNITDQGSARENLQKGVTASIDKVLSFPAAVGVTVPDDKIPSAAQVTNYINLVLSNYDTATTDDSRLNVIMTEYYLAAWGNGVETYNNYRLTGKPNNMQPARAVADPGLFMRSFFYPNVFINRNSNAPAQKDPGNTADKVFWDNNPDNFIH